MSNKYGSGSIDTSFDLKSNSGTDSRFGATSTGQSKSGDLNANLSFDNYRKKSPSTAYNTDFQPAGLAASENGSSVYQGIMADREKINKLELENKNLMKEQEGPSRFAANASAIGGLGLGIASYFENKKTSQLQRKQMEQNLQASADYNRGRKERSASWSESQARPVREINA
jgi:hypothetical protein